VKKSYLFRRAFQVKRQCQFDIDGRIVKKYVILLPKKIPGKKFF
jgi:hypothetical protein